MASLRNRIVSTLSALFRPNASGEADQTRGYSKDCMPMNLEDPSALKALESRLVEILPEEYQDSYENVQPVSMGSAALKYGDDGKVAWDDMWETFCDLAMAGGPPHKGALLQPGSRAEIEAQPEAYGKVVEEICRGIALVAELPVQRAPIPGWVRVKCESSAMADWLVRAIVMENVSARSEGMTLDLPAGPAYRVEKEIKNVITAIAKTCHYWLYHMGQNQQWNIGDLFAAMALESPLIQPALAEHDPLPASQQAAGSQVAEAILQKTGLRVADHFYTNWLGFECRDVRSAIWMMRAVVVCNVLARREGTVLFVPVNPASDPGGERVVYTLSNVYRLARSRAVV